MATTTKTALVTGATTGIGAAAASALAVRGYTVYGTGRDSGRVPTDGGIRPLELDVTDEDSMVSAAKAVLAERPAIDLLVNNAGYGLNGFLEDLPIDEIRRQFETNVFGLIRMTQLAVPSMRAAGGGRVIHVGSVGGIITAPGAGAYHASKFAVEAISDVHRMELRPFGIRVTLIQPTGVHTPFLTKLDDTYPGTGPDSAYAHLLEGHKQSVADLHANGPNFLVIPAEKVGEEIAKQADARRPKSRVRVGASAKMFATLRRNVPDNVWDRMATSAI
ncbi:SDR family NAD(P)-dependent oxidoreductase [Euzebya tangerina]|uniref:SDR family NAD(P)-dependent oxidoreductase n=1 Tax=Euzebya tangerina TaxID=591198 RepID=UPI000E30FD2B|nr:SDR family NAD(P)-dependent oxidoreductase [Euzebya tangerina]